MKFFLFLLLSFFSFSGFSKTLDELEANIGLVNVSFSEIASQLTGPNVADPASGSHSILSANFAYHFYRHGQWSVYGGGTVPMLTTAGVGFFSMLAGGEYYFNKLPHYIVAENYDIRLRMRPNLRYYVNLELSLNYLIYSTEEEKKGDMSFGIGGGAGLSYTISNDWALKTKFVVSKDTGVITEGISTKFFVGGIYFLDF